MYPKIRPVYVMHEEGVSRQQLETVLEGIREVLFWANMDGRIEVKNYGAWRHSDYRQGKMGFRPYHSVDWYLAEAQMKSARPGQINAEVLMHHLLVEPWQKHAPHYDVFVTKQDMYSGDTNFVIGLASAGRTTIVSTHRFRQLVQNSQLACIKTETIHEVGHVFGLVPGYRTEAVAQSLGRHCTNTCTMRQGLRLPDDWVGMSEDRLRLGRPYCQLCLTNLNRYFLE